MFAAINRSEKGVFATEAAMVEHFVSFLHGNESPWKVRQTTTEWDYRTGITDVLMQTDDGQIVAFEAKLTDWRRAVHQAYRNTTFAGRAYIVLPSSVAERVRANEQFFARYGVGLCALDADNINILIEAIEAKPLLPWLYERAQLHFNTTASDNLSRNSRKNSRTALRAA